VPTSLSDGSRMEFLRTTPADDDALRKLRRVISLLFITPPANDWNS
jgi:hypothetical protein